MLRSSLYLDGMDAQQNQASQRLAIADEVTEAKGNGDRNESPLPGGRAYLAEIWELTWLPLTLALIVAGVTWTVWNFTTDPCTPELAKAAKCSLSSWAKFINLDLMNKMFTHGAIAGGTGGVWNYVMIRRERQRAEEAERRAEMAERRLEEERRRSEEERRRGQEERRQADEDRRLLLEQIAILTQRVVNGSNGSQE